MPGRRMRHAVAALFFAGAAFAWSWPLPAEFGSAVPWDLGDPLWSIHLLESNRRALAGGGGLWDGVSFFPNLGVLAFSEHLLGPTLLAWPLSSATGNPVVAYNAVLVSGLFASALAAYALATVLGAGFAGALLAGSLYGFGPFRYAQMLHLPMAWTPFLPLALLASHAAMTGGRWLACAGVGGAVALQWSFSCHFGAFTVYAVAVFWLWAWATKRLEARTFARLLAVAAATVVVLAPVVWPYFEVRSTYGFRRTLMEQREMSADLLEFVWAPGWSRLWSFLPPTLRNPSGGDHENGMGWCALAIAAVGTVAILRSSTVNRGVRWAPWLWVFGFVLALGPRLHVAGDEVILGTMVTLGKSQTLHVNLPYLVLHHLPGLEGIRAVSRFGIVAFFAAALLAAFGIGAVVRAVRERAGPRTSAVAGAILVVVCLAELYGGPLPLARPPMSDQGESVYRFLGAESPRGAVVELPLAEPHRDGDSPYHEALYLFRQRLHGRRLLNGYSSSTPPDYYVAVRMGPRFPDAASIAYFRSRGVRYVVVHDGMRAGPKCEPARVPNERILSVPAVFRAGPDWLFDLGPVAQARGH